MLKENKYLKKFGYIGESDYDRVLEYLVVITNYVKQLSKSSPERISSQIATLFHLRGDSVPYSRKLFFKIVLDNTNNKGLIQLNYVKFKEVSNKPLSYYSVVGSSIELIQDDSSLSTLGSIINALQDYPNGITAENLRRDSRILEKERISANLNILKEKSIIVRHKEKEITYLPSIEERIFRIIKNNVDNVDENIINIHLNQQLFFIQEQGVDIKNNVDIKRILDKLVEAGLIIYNDEALTYQTDKKEYNAFLGLVKEQYNSTFKYDPNNTNELNKISTNIIQDYVNYPDNFYILKILVDYYDNITLFTANEIYTILKSKFSRQISLSTVKEYIHGYRNRPSFFKMHGFIDIYVQQQLKEINETTTRDNKKKWIILNSNSSVLAKSILYMYFNFQPIQHGFGTYIYPIFFNYILGDIINNSLHTIDELIKYINESDNKTRFILSILKTINGNISTSEIIHTIFKGVNNFNDKNLLQSINSLLKYGNQTNIGSDNTNMPFDNAIHFGFFIIDLRKFILLNNNDINKGIDTFTNLLLWKDKSYKFQILDMVKRKSLTYLNNASDEYMLVEFTESFWDIFAKYIYGNELLDLVNSMKLILNFNDNNLNPDTYEELGNSKSDNTKFFEYLTEGINSQQDFQNVYSNGSDLKTIKIKILYDIILYLLASTINNQTAKGHAMTENDKTGWNAWSTVDRIGGHSDTAFNLPERWFSLNSYKYSYSAGYNNWWKNNKVIGDIDLEFKNISQRKSQLLKLSQYYYLLGQPNPAGIPSNNNKSNNDILKENLTKYCNQPIDLHSNNFLSLVFEIIKIYGNPIKSILGISRPISMKYIINQQERTFEAINTISIVITSLDVYKNILALNNSLFAIYTDNTLNNNDIIKFFDSLGIHSNIYNENSTKIINILSIDDEILYKMNNQVKNPTTLLLIKIRKNNREVVFI